jgi:tRNA (guanine6-N2)-methyltransferase
MTPAPRLLLASTFPGLEGPLAEEVAERLGAAVIEARRGRVTFPAPVDVRQALSLRAADRIELLLARVEDLPVSRAGLDALEALGPSLELHEAGRMAAEALGVTGPTTFRVTGERRGAHAFTSMEAAAALGAGIVAATGWRVRMTGFALDVRLAIDGADAWVGIALHRDELHRRHGPPLGPAPLRCTVAHALLRMLAPRPGERIVDPMCGSATLPIELALAWPGCHALGGDLDGRALDRAEEAVARAGARVSLARWDARRLPLPRGSVDGVVCNLPFGTRVGSHRRNQHLYPGFVRELTRVLRPGGRAVLLTGERRLVERLAGRDRLLSVASEVAVELSGKGAVVFTVLRAAE